MMSEWACRWKWKTGGKNETFIVICMINISFKKFSLISYRFEYCSFYLCVCVRVYVCVRLELAFIAQPPLFGYVKGFFHLCFCFLAETFQDTNCCRIVGRSYTVVYSFIYFCRFYSRLNNQIFDTFSLIIWFHLEIIFLLVFFSSSQSVQFIICVRV